MQRVELSPVPPAASPPSLRKAATTPARSQFSAKDPSAGLTPPAAAAANRAKKPTAAAATPLTRTPSNASAKADSRQPQQTPLRTSPPAVVATAGVKVGSPAVNGRGSGGSTASPASPRRNLTASAVVASPGLAKKAAGPGAAGKAAPPSSNPGPTKPAYTSTPKARVLVAGTPSAVASADSDLLHDATRSGVNNNTAASMHNGDHNGISSLSDVSPPPMSSLVSQDVPPRQVFVESEALAVVSPSSPRAGSLGSSVESVVSSSEQVSLEEREDALLIVEEEEQLLSSGLQQRRSSSRLSLVSSGGERKISEKTTLVELVTTTETPEDETDFRQKIQQEIPLVEGRKSSMTNGGSNYWATQALNNANTASIYQVYNKKVQKTVFSHRECQTFTAQFWGLRYVADSWLFFATGFSAFCGYVGTYSTVTSSRSPKQKLRNKVSKSQVSSKKSFPLGKMM